MLSASVVESIHIIMSAYRFSRYPSKSGGSYANMAAPSPDDAHGNHDTTYSTSNGISMMGGSTANGVLIGLLSSFGSAILIALIFIVVYFFKYTQGGRILLDRIGRPGEYDDEQNFLREEAEALETMEEGQRIDYLRAKGMLCLLAALLFKEEVHVLTVRLQQRLSKPTHQILYPPISHFPNT